jgi:voltage-gated sodium channel
MSFINSIFVDAMVADNNDDVKLKLDEIEEKVNRLLENMDKKK